MLGKWSYKWIGDRHRPWNKWVRSKYNCTSYGNIRDDLGNKSLSDTMKGILEAAGDPNFQSVFNGNNFCWKIRSGHQALFWEDNWLDGGSLQSVFKKLYLLSSLKAVTVSEFFWYWSNIPHDSLYLWNRTLRSWELEEVKRLELQLTGV